MTDSPYDVAVVIPFLNAETTLAESIESIVAQTVFPRVRTILVDNASTDGSPDIAARYVDKHENVDLFRRDGGGCGGARNRGLDEVREPVVTFLDADDVLPPTSLERRLELLHRWGADVVMGAIETFPDVRPYTRPDVYAPDRVVEGLAADPRVMRAMNVAAIVFRSEFFDDPQHRFLEDVSFEDVSVTTAALMSASRIGVSSQVCYRYRKDPAHATIMSTAYTRPGNYRDILAVSGVVQARHAHDPVAGALVARTLISIVQPFLEHAPRALGDADLRDFFDRARRLYSAYPAELVAEHVRRPVWSVPFYALLAGDLELFRDPQAHVRGIKLVDGAAHLALDRAVAPEHRRLLRVQPLRRADIGTVAATLTSARARRRGRLDLAGTVEIVDGGRLHVPPLGYGFVLHVGTTGVSVPVTVRRAGRHGPATWAARIDLAAVPDGRHRLALGAQAWSLRKREGIRLASSPLTASSGAVLAPNKAGTGTFLLLRRTSP